MVCSLLESDALACSGSAMVESVVGGKGWEGVRGVVEVDEMGSWKGVGGGDEAGIVFF